MAEQVIRLKFGIKTGQDLHTKFLPVERPMKVNLPDRVRKVRN